MLNYNTWGNIFLATWAARGLILKHQLTAFLLTLGITCVNSGPPSRHQEEHSMRRGCTGRNSYEGKGEGAAGREEREEERQESHTTAHLETSWGQERDWRSRAKAAL